MVRFPERVGESVPRHMRSIGERGKSLFRRHGGTDGVNCIHLCKPAVPEAAGRFHHLVATFCSQPPHDSVDMIPDCKLRQIYLGGDFFVRQALCDKRNDLLLEYRKTVH